MRIKMLDMHVEKLDDDDEDIDTMKRKLTLTETEIEIKKQKIEEEYIVKAQLEAEFDLYPEECIPQKGK